MLDDRYVVRDAQAGSGLAGNGLDQCLASCGGHLSAKDDHVIADIHLDAELDGAGVRGESVLDLGRETVRRVIAAHSPFPSQATDLPIAPWHNRDGICARTDKGAATFSEAYPGGLCPDKRPSNA